MSFSNSSDSTEATSVQATRRTLRRRVLRQRARIDDATRDAFTASLNHALISDPRIRPARHVAIYDAMASEAPTAQAIAALWSRGVSVYLPQVRGRAMRFVAVQPGMPLQAHALGMRQPRGRWLRRVLDLDVVLMPLAGFDLSGQRLGLGGGFYDRALATRRHRRAWRRPWLVGLAFSAQCLDAVPVMRHDVPLDAVITEHGVTHFSHTPHEDRAWPTG